MRELDNLDGGEIALLDGGHHVVGQRDVRETDCSVGRLVEGLHQGDVEARDVVAQAQVDVRLRPRVRRHEGHRTALNRPGGPVGGRRTVDVAAFFSSSGTLTTTGDGWKVHTRVGPLRRKAVAAPGRVRDTKMCGGRCGQ